MTSKTTTIASVLLTAAFFMVPFSASASTLLPAQVQAIAGLLRAFGVSETTVLQVEQTLGVSSALVVGSSSQTGISDPPTPSPLPPPPHIPATGSPYLSSNVGFDLSFNSLSYPSNGFNFGIVGVSGGKAFVHNSRLVSEYSWTHFGSMAPTVYMNLNAPYGTTVAGNIGTPKSCPAHTATSTEPTACEGYNYGYNAAKDAYSYAKDAGVSSKLWWLDIEEENSWSPDTAVNDATIQGAIDYLNTQGARAGIYSMAYMWRNIAGTSFAPTQMIDGQTVSIPTWVPIGISNLVDAINTCMTSSSFVVGSPIWLVQYVADSTSVDQNVAC